MYDLDSDALHAIVELFLAEKTYIMRQRGVISRQLESTMPLYFLRSQRRIKY